MGSRLSRRGRAARRLGIATVFACVAGAGAWLALDALHAPRPGRAAPAASSAVAAPLRIVFPEGYTRADMAAQVAAVDAIARRQDHVDPRLSAREYLRVSARAAPPAAFRADDRSGSLEGFLFPATYPFGPTTSSGTLVAEQLRAFRENWATVDLASARARGLGPYAVLTIASMVEREALAPDERALVAAVVYNRLRARMPLAIDATIRYGLHIPGTEAIRESQLHSPSPYNTRVHRGLPPTPIANPGLASMQAAAHPAAVDYLYYVRKPDRVHHFFTRSRSVFERYLRAHGYS